MRAPAASVEAGQAHHGTIPDRRIAVKTDHLSPHTERRVLRRGAVVQGRPHGRATWLGTVGDDADLMIQSLR